MSFKFSKNQQVRASQNTRLGEVKQGTRGRVMAHRVDPEGNVYLIRFRGKDGFVQCSEHELEKA